MLSSLLPHTCQHQLQEVSVNTQSVQSIQSLVVGVENAMSVAQTDIVESQPLSDADAATALVSIQSLCVTMRAAIMTIIQSQQVLTEAGASSVVVESLQSQASLTSSISQSILALLPAAEVGSAQLSLDGMTSALNIGISTLTQESSSTAIIANQAVPPSSQAVSPQACAAVGFVPASQGQAGLGISPQQCQGLGLVQSNQTAALAQNSTQSQQAAAQQIAQQQAELQACAAIGFVPANQTVQSPPSAMTRRRKYSRR